MNAGVILFLIFAVCVLIGVPISMSLGIGSLAAVALGNLGVSPAVIAQRVFGGLQSTSKMCIRDSSTEKAQGCPGKFAKSLDKAVPGGGII